MIIKILRDSSSTPLYYAFMFVISFKNILLNHLHDILTNTVLNVYVFSQTPAVSYTFHCLTYSFDIVSVRLTLDLRNLCTYAFTIIDMVKSDFPHYYYISAVMNKVYVTGAPGTLLYLYLILIF